MTTADLVRPSAVLLSFAALLGCGAASTSEPPSPIATTGSDAPSVAVPSGEPARIVRADRFHALMPTAVTSFGAAVIGDRLYTAGGYHGEPHNYTPEGQSGEVWSVSLENGNDWRAHPGIDPMQGEALVAHGTELCVIGGMRVRPDGTMYSIADVRCLDTTADSASWVARAPLPAPRSTHDAWVMGDTVYVVGGWALDGDSRSGVFATTMATLDLSHPEAAWAETEAPFRRRAIAAAGTDGWLAVIGGLTEAGQVSSEVDVYDVATRTWRTGPALTEDGFGIAATRVGNTVVASARGGTLWELNAGATAWADQGSLAFPRFFHRLVSHGDRVIALGGMRGMMAGARVRHVEVVNPVTEPSFTVIDLPNAGAARNRQGVFLVDGTLHLFGGNNSLGQHDFEPANFESAHHVLAIDGLSWTDAAAYPFPRQTISTVVSPDGTSGIAMGGFGHDGPEENTSGAAHTHPEGFRYLFEDDRWEPRPGLPVSRSQFGLVEHEGSLFVFGGLDYDPSRSGDAAPSSAGDEAFRHLTEVLAGPADGSGPFTVVATPMPEARRAFGGALIGGTYYLVGGMHGEFELVEGCRAVELATMTWREIACPAYTRLNPQLVTIGERLYLVGGTSVRDGEFLAEPSIEVYEPSTNSWSTLIETMPLEPRHLRAFEHRGRLVLFSTHDEQPLAHLAILTLP
jgi:hypothetical protein